MDICFDTNGKKKTNLADLQFLLKDALFSKTWCRKLLKKLKYESILYNSTKVSVAWHPENFKIKLYYSQERLRLRYDNPAVTVSISYMFLAK